jgi:hypothetical protein
MSNWKSICSNKEQNIVYAVSYNNGIYKSIDYGITFTHIFSDKSVVKYFWSISCDNTGDYVICGCMSKKVLCSNNAGNTFVYLTINDLGGSGIYALCNPDALLYVNDEKSIFICFSTTGTNQIFSYVYYNSENNIFTYHSQNFGNYVNNINLNSKYIMIAGTYTNNVRIYNYPEGYNSEININEPVLTISDIIILSPFTMSSCNDDYVLFQGIDKNNFNYILVRAYLKDFSSEIIKINLNESVSLMQIDSNNDVYVLLSNTLKFIKYTFINNTYVINDIKTLNKKYIWISINSSSYNNIIFIGTFENNLFYFNTTDNIFYESIIN